MVELNHLIVWCADKNRSASHLAEMLGVDPPRDFAGQFAVVDLSNGVSVDYGNWSDGDPTPQHLAFLVSEGEFDEIYGRIKAQEITHWADPSKRTPGKINHHDGGRGVYWDDPGGNLLEIITRPYGAETGASGD